MTGPLSPPPSGGTPRSTPARPVDVDTGFWLWLAALPVTVSGYVVKALALPQAERTGSFYVIVAVTAVAVCAVVVALLLAMRAGHRWARTVLTGGGLAAVVFAVTDLFETDPHPGVAVTVAVTGIVGSVLIAGGTFLLHRTDAHGYFTR